MADRGTDYYEIQRLLYLYCYHLDRGEFRQMAELFAKARFLTPGGGAVERDPAAIVAMYEQYTRLYPDTGTPKTRHTVSNPIIDLANDGRSARCHSYIVVFQATDTLSLQPVIAGHNRDRFIKEGGTDGEEWRYEEREIVSELFGDLSEHMLRPFGPKQA